MRSAPDERENLTELTEEEWKVHNLKTLTDDQWKQVLSYTLCPLSRQYMDDPVVWGGSKRAYDRGAVKDYVAKYKKDPISDEPLQGELILKPNINIRQLCKDYKPYFDILPEERKTRLIDLTLPIQRNIEQNTAESSASHESTSRSSGTFFSKDSSRTAGKQEAENDDDDAGVDKSLLCPIRHVLMVDPVTLGTTGHTFEREAIEEWLDTLKRKSKKPTDPLTNKEITNTTLTPNYALKPLCDKARENLTAAASSSNP